MTLIRSSTCKAASIVDVAVGARVRDARMESGLSQQALADALNLSFQQVKKYEKGIDRIAASRLVEIAALLGKSASWFFMSAPQTRPGQYGVALETLGTPDGLELAAHFRHVKNAEIRRQFIELVSAFVSEGR